MKHIAKTVGTADHGSTLQEYVAAHRGLSRRKAKDLIDTRLVFVNAQCVWMARHILKRGDVVELPADKTRAAANGPSPLNLLYDTNDIIAVGKPAGLVCTGDNSLERRLQAALHAPGLRMVHRLDRNTTGCVLAARTESARQALVTQFRENRVTKVYHAIVRGHVNWTERTVKAPVGAQRAVSHLRVLAANRRAAHLSIRIETGRTHQIRRHLAGLRHPVIGDVRHGRTAPSPIPTQQPKAARRQMLHSASVQFHDPLTNKHVRARVPLPADMRACLRELNLK